MSTGRGIRRRGSTDAQLAELRALGYARLSFVYSHEEADLIIAELKADRTKRKAQEEKQSPVLLTAWQRGEAQLDHHGYTVSEMPGTWGVCYEVVGGAEPYHVCIDARRAEYGCSCPDGILRGDMRPCKHMLAVLVQLWRWAQEATDDYTDWLEQYGITALYRAGHREKQAEQVSRESSEATNPGYLAQGESDSLFGDDLPAAGIRDSPAGRI